MNQGLSRWFALWHPRYRRALIGLVVTATLASALVYLENSLLDWLTQSLAAEPAESSLPYILITLARRFAVSIPFLTLGLFIITRLAYGAIEFAKTWLSGKLQIQSKDDLETEILLHLLRKDDSFFSRHSPAEMVNRLAVDLSRVSERRPGLTRICWSSLMLAGNLAFFLIKDWRLAIVAVSACSVGVLWTLRITRPVETMDGLYLEQDDRVKSRFEDLLRSAPEVQVANIYEKIRNYFKLLLDDRSNTFLEYIRLSGTLHAGNTVSYLLAFAAMILVVYYVRATGAVNASLALVPVIVLRLPALFSDASELVFLRLEFKVAHASMDRLLEYESQAVKTGPPPAVAPPMQAAESIAIETATYRYAGADGTEQGGIAEVSTTFAPGRWTAVVGGAGSGKSTLLKLLLGRLKPQHGHVVYGQSPLEEMSDGRRAALFSLMPQSAALLNASIRENLLFGRSHTDASLSHADLEVMESAGLGRVCRLQALDMVPGDSPGERTMAEHISELRHRLRSRLRDQCKISVLLFEDGHCQSQHWLLEYLLGGKCDHARVVDLLAAEKARRKLQTAALSPNAATFIALGRCLLQENSHLLGINNYHVYSQLSPQPVAEPLWRLRSSCLKFAAKDRLSAAEAVSLWLVGLSSSFTELASDPRAEELRKPESRQQFFPEIELLKPLIAGHWRPFRADQVHPHLSWRENLIFGVVVAPDHRTARLLDQTVLSFAEQAGLKDCFTRLGMEFEIGRLGSKLSGGQGQLVALCRSLLRNTPVLILDEPTSALDPASRSAVAELLRRWKHQKIVITVSHDVEFIKEADEIKLIDSGRLVASGTFKELEQTSEVFRNTLRRL